MLKNYVKIAFKVLMRRKFFTFISLFAISFTLVVLMVAASMLDLMFAPTPPETKQDRTLGIFRAVMSGKQSIEVGNPGYAFLSKFVKTLPDVEMVGIYSTGSSVTSFKDGYEIKSQVKYTDGEYWRILDFQFLEGGPISDDDEARGNYVAVINQATRQKLFGEEPGLGKFVEFDRRRFRIVGVVANVPEYRRIPFADIWVPVSTYPEAGYREDNIGDFNGLILAKHRTDFDRICEEFRARLKSVPLPSSDFDNFDSVLETAFDSAAREFIGDSYSTDEGTNMIRSYTGEVVGLLILVVFLFMLLPTINLVNINVSRMIERASEIGVRKSFGASSITLIGQFLVENVLLTFVGGIIGFVFSLVILKMITESGMIQYGEFHLNARLFLYALASILVFGVFSGVYPAWKMARLNPVDALKGATR